MLRLLLVFLRRFALVPSASALGFIAGLRRGSRRRCAASPSALVPCALALGFAAVLSPGSAAVLRRCAASPSALVPCALAPGFIAGLRRPLPPRCWVQKRPPQSSQKLWGGRLFAVASFALRPCALRVSAGLRRSAPPLRRCAFRLVPCASALGFAAVLRRFAAVPLRPPPCALRVSAGLRRRAPPLRRFALRLVPCASALGSAASPLCLPPLCPAR